MNEKAEKLGNQRIYPFEHQIQEIVDDLSYMKTEIIDGLTKREYFIAKAMQGMVAACESWDKHNTDLCFEIADEFLEKLAEE